MKYIFSLLGITGIVLGFVFPTILVDATEHYLDSYLILLFAAVAFLGVLANIKILLFGVFPLIIFKALTINTILDFMNTQPTTKLGIGAYAGYIGAFLLLIAAIFSFNDSTTTSKLKHNTKEIRYWSFLYRRSAMM